MMAFGENTGSREERTRLPHCQYRPALLYLNGSSQLLTSPDLDVATAGCFAHSAALPGLSQTELGHYLGLERGTGL